MPREWTPHWFLDLGERYATSIINDLNRWTRAWLDWNLILDEKGGPNHVGNYCSAPIIYDTSKMKFYTKVPFITSDTFLVL